MDKPTTDNSVKHVLWCHDQAPYKENLKYAGLAEDVLEDVKMEWVSSDTYRLAGAFDSCCGGINPEKVIEDWRGKSEFTLEITSPGGSIYDGYAILAFLEKEKPKVRAVAIGEVASVAMLPFAYASERVIMPSSMLMIHKPMSFGAFGGNINVLRPYFEGILNGLESMTSVYEKAIAALSKDAVAKMQAGANVWFTAETAKAAGLVTEIGEARKDDFKGVVDLALFRANATHHQMAERLAVKGGNSNA